MYFTPTAQSTEMHTDVTGLASQSFVYKVGASARAITCQPLHKIAETL